MKTYLQTILAMDEGSRKHTIEQAGLELPQQMLENIGATDNELRDHLNYRVFVEALSAGYWHHEQLTYFATHLATDEFLYYKLTEADADAVFRRSFSALWLTNLLQVDAQQAFLTTEQSQAILEQAVRYLERERDVRGFTGEAGWAHSVAHGADLAVACIGHPAFELRFAPLILQGMKAVLWKGTVYTDDEDERLVNIIQALAAINFPEDVLVEWVEQVFDKLTHHLYTQGYNQVYYHARTNTMQLMKTLYFSLKFSHRLDKLRGTTSIFIQRWSK